MSADDCPKCKEHPVDCTCGLACQLRQTDHPWQVFLDARADAIDWLRNIQCHDDERIAYTLSMDTQQVYLIRTRNRALDLRKWKKLEGNSPCD